MIECCAPEVLCRTEVVVDEVVTHAEPPGEFAHRHGFESGFGKGLERGIEDLATRVVACGAGRAAGGSSPSHGGRIA